MAEQRIEPLSIRRIVRDATGRVARESPREVSIPPVVIYLVATSLVYTINLFVLFHDARDLLKSLSSVSDAIKNGAPNHAFESFFGIVKEKIFYWVISYAISVCSWIVFVRLTEVVLDDEERTPEKTWEELRLRASASRELFGTYFLASLLIFACVAVVVVISGVLRAALGKWKLLFGFICFVFVMVCFLLYLLLIFYSGLACVVSMLDKRSDGDHGYNRHFKKAFEMMGKDWKNMNEEWKIMKEVGNLGNKRKCFYIQMFLLLLLMCYGTSEPCRSIVLMILNRRFLGWIGILLPYVGVSLTGLVTVFSIVVIAVYYLDWKRRFVDSKPRNGGDGGAPVRQS